MLSAADTDNGVGRCDFLDTVQYRSIVSMMSVAAGTGDDIDVADWMLLLLPCCCHNGH
jgi:hypothetical protein